MPRPLHAESEVDEQPEASGDASGLLAEIRSKNGGGGLRKIARERRGTTTRKPGQSAAHAGHKRMSIAKISARRESTLMSRLQSTLAARRHVISATTRDAIDEESDTDSWDEEDDFD
jgi:hypothetical protein